MCVYRATQDGSWGLTFVIYFNHDIQVLSWWRNSRIIFRSLVWLNQYTHFFELSLTFLWIPPDGSNQCFADDVAKVPLLFPFVDLFLSGARQRSRWE
jgi:hypothetical protein